MFVLKKVMVYNKLRLGCNRLLEITKCNISIIHFFGLVIRYNYSVSRVRIINSWAVPNKTKVEMKRILAILFVVFLVSCAPMVNPAPTETMIPTATITPNPPTSTNTPTSTPKPTKTPIPIIYVSLGSPYATDCGDGIPRVLFDNEFNGIEKSELIDSRHGHVDLYPPMGCDIYSYSGEIIAPVSGKFLKDTQNSPSFFIYLPQYTLIDGIDKVLENSGVSNFSPNLVENIRINISHFAPLPDLQNNSFVMQGQVIGDLEPETGNKNPIKFAFHIQILYNGTSYSYSPTMFLKETGEKAWECIGEFFVPGVGACNLQYNYYP